MKGKIVILIGLSTKLQLNFGIILVCIKPMETLLSGEVCKKNYYKKKPLKKDAVELNLLLRVSYN